MTHRPVAWITHPACRLHDMGADHPESPQRLDAIADRLRSTGLDGFLAHFEAPLATVEQVQRVHSPAHVERVLNYDARGELLPIDDDTAQGPHTLSAALHAAGAGVLAVEKCLRNEAGLAFCAVRPPGHHAERGRAMGFCFFNNVAVAAAHALSLGIERIAILDFDLHYGNGTADIFAGDDRVWLLSTFQHPLYPGWSGVSAARNLVDVPLPAHSGGTAYRAAVTEHWLPALERLRPQIILVSAGFDAHRGDPLGDLRLEFDDYRWTGAVIRELAETCCDGRVVATLEGGYDRTALGRCVESFLRPFLGEELPV